MDQQTKNLQGSPSRDKFKRKHKDLSRQFYACDIDFVFVEKEPLPDIVAALDYKAFGDAITFSETIAYMALVKRGIPVFIVTGNADAGVFKIDKFIGGHHKKPRHELKHTASTCSWEEFSAWESSLRQAYRQTVQA